MNMNVHKLEIIGNTLKPIETGKPDRAEVEDAF